MMEAVVEPQEVRRVRVLIVDDHRMFREGVRTRLEKETDIEVVGEAGTGKEGLEAVLHNRPDVVLLDIRLPDASGIDVARELRRVMPSLRILVLTGYDFDQYVHALARVGVEGYLLKDAPQETLVEAIREIAAGGAVLTPSVASKVMRSYSGLFSAVKSGQLGDLTMREMEILDLMCQGLKNPEMADRLGISGRTVESHINNVMSKLGARTRADAVRIALEQKLTP